MTALIVGCTPIIVKKVPRRSLVIQQVSQSVSVFCSWPSTPGFRNTLRAAIILRTHCSQVLEFNALTENVPLPTGGFVDDARELTWRR